MSGCPDFALFYETPSSPLPDYSLRIQIFRNATGLPCP